jgi:uncharacterized protein involved in exopolysaccharide biosynthesis
MYPDYARSSTIEEPKITEHSALERPAIEFSMLDLAILALERRRLILRWTLTLGLLATILAFVWPVSYTATTAILPPQQNGSLSSTLLSQLGGLGSLAALGSGGGDGPLSLKNPIDMHIALMKSEPVEDAIIRRFELMHEYHDKYLSVARQDLEKHVDIEGGAKDGLIRLSATDHNPARAAELANAYVQQYRNLSASLATTEASQRRMFFEQQLEQAKDNLAHAEEALKSTEQTTGMLQMDSQARALIESGGVLRAQIAAKEVQIQSMSTYDAESNVDLIQAQHELGELKAQLAKLTGSGNDTDAGLVLPKGQLPQAALEYIRKARDVKYYETIFEILARQFEAAKLDEAKEGAIIQVVYPASVPDRKSKPHRLLLIVAGVLVGFLGSLMFVVLHTLLAKAQDIPEHREKWERIKILSQRQPSRANPRS